MYKLSFNKFFGGLTQLGHFSTIVRGHPNFFRSIQIKCTLFSNPFLPLPKTYYKNADVKLAAMLAMLYQDQQFSKA